MYAQIYETVADWEEAIRVGCKPLVDNGHVTEKFVELVIEREKKWPTGLPSFPIGVAIPHAETRDQIIKADISVVVLNEPVIFMQAGTHETPVPVKLVFVLALNDSTQQLNMIAGLMECISNEENLRKLMQAETGEAFLRVYKCVCNYQT